MAIFKKRPLAAACVVLILAAALAFPFSFFYTAVMLIPLAVATICLLIFCIVRGFHYARLFVFLLLLGVLLGAGRTLLERRQAQEAFGQLMGETVDAVFEVEGIDAQGAYESRLIVSLERLDGTPCHERLLFVTEGRTPFYIGDCVSGSFVCTELSEHSYYQGQETQYYADGIYAAFTVTEEGEPVLLEGGTDTFGTRVADLRGTLHYQLTSAVKGEKGELLSALLLGTKESLDGSTVLQFRRVGLSHLLALSGLHLAIIVGALETVLRLFRVGKRARAAILLLVMFLFWMLTGCSVSMLRAVLMFAVLQLAFFVKGDYDAFTALCLVGALMVLAAPGAVFDLSFQMTMLATFGILAFGDLQGKLLSLFPRRKGVSELGLKVLRFVSSSLFITLVATVAILPIQWLVFGEMSLLTPVANLLMIPLATVLLWIALPLLPLSFIPAVALPLGAVAGWIAGAMLWLTRELSRLPSMLSLNYAFVPYIFVPLILLTVLLLLVDLKKLRALTLAPTGLAILAFALCLAVFNRLGEDKVDVIFRTTGSNDGLLLVQNGTSVICDISNGSITQMREDYMLLQEHCATEIEVLMLTHYHTRQVAAIARFADSVMLRALWLPQPQSGAEKQIQEDLMDIAAQNGIAVTVYEHGVPLTVFDNGEIMLSTPLYEERSVEAALSLRVSCGETSLGYQSAAYSEYARNTDIEANEVSEDYLILGGHGPVPHAEVAPVMDAIPLEIVIANETALQLHTTRYDTSYILLPQTVSYRLE